MKVVKLKGGLGNQFFQYAFGKSIEKETNTSIKYDTTWFKTGADYDHDILYLDFFDTDYEVANKSEIQNLYPLNGLGKRIAERLYSRLPFISQLLFSHIREIHRGQNSIFRSEPYRFEYSPKVYSIGSDSYFDGYWQTSQYVNKVADILTKDFSLAEPMSEQSQVVNSKIKKSNSVSIHIRRGDYIKNDNTLSLDYYTRSIEEINSRITYPEYYIFSDDIKWVRKELEIKNDCTFVDFNGVETAHEDLMLMSSCKHNIIANSTFSWWGAWLNQNYNKIVIAPDNWLGGGKY